MRDSQNLLALGPPTSSVPGVDTLGIVQSQGLQGAGYVLLVWLVLDSPLSQRQCPAQETHSLHCDDSGPGATTLLSSYAPRSKLRACFRPSCRPTMKKSSPCTKTSPSLCGKMARRCHASGKSSSLQNLSVLLSPPLGCIQGSVHCLLQFPTLAWLLCLGVFVRQSNVDVTHRVSVEVSSTHVCDGDQERVLNSENVFLARNTE